MPPSRAHKEREEQAAAECLCRCALYCHAAVFAIIAIIIGITMTRTPADAQLGELERFLKSAYTEIDRQHNDEIKRPGGYSNPPRTHGELLPEGVLGVLHALADSRDDVSADEAARRSSSLAAPLALLKVLLEGVLQGARALETHVVLWKIKEDRRPRPPQRLQPSDVVVDIGSGVGKVALALGALTDARVVGIEVEPFRAARAEEALAGAIRRGLLSEGDGARLTLRHADATEDGELPEDATLVYISNTLFGVELTQDVVARLVLLPKLQCVAAHTRLDTYTVVPSEDASGSPPPACELEHARELRVPTTWDKASHVHVYCCRGRV